MLALVMNVGFIWMLSVAPVNLGEQVWFSAAAQGHADVCEAYHRLELRKDALVEPLREWARGYCA